MRLWHFLKEHMQCHLRQEVCENGTSATYGELIAFAESFAARLTGFRSCAVLCGSEMAASAALLSCFAAGVTAVPLSARYGEAHCQKILDTVSPDALITDTGGELRVTRLCGFGYREPLCRPALIMCTSGTTGTPKGAMLTESNVMTNVADIAAYFRLSADDRLLIARPLYHCAVLTGEWLTALVQGAGIRFYLGEYHPAFVLKLLKEHGITAFGGTPTWLSAMARFREKRRGRQLAVYRRQRRVPQRKNRSADRRRIQKCGDIPCLRADRSGTARGVSAPGAVFGQCRLCGRAAALSVAAHSGG